ncbi:MAG: methionyl-tRNA formyltransferase [Treponema sp.]|nr:methionyl-tRNA formyltransferase [Treponema sp.]
MRILFAGSPAIAVPSLEAICNIENVELAGVLTNPDSAKGRKGTLSPTEAGEAALRLGVTSILKPEKLDGAFREHVISLKCDLLVSFAYGRIFGPKFLSLFPLGGINIHPSLLPKYRGPSPVQAAILNRDSVTGISIQTLAEKMDEGGILASEEFQLTGAETALSLGEIAAQKAALMLPQTLKKIAEGRCEAKSQDHANASYCKLITRDDGIINWSKNAPEIEAEIRAFNPWPLCRTFHNERELYILKSMLYKGSFQQDLSKGAGYVLGIDKQYGILIQTGGGILAVTQLQYHAKKALDWQDFLNGARGFIGSKF